MTSEKEKALNLSVFLYTKRCIQVLTQYADIKEVIIAKCGLSEVILDNLQNEGNGMKVTVGVAAEEDAAILVRKINGLYFRGQQLYVQDKRQKKESEQPYRTSIDQSRYMVQPMQQGFDYNAQNAQIQASLGMYQTVPSFVMYPQPNQNIQSYMGFGAQGQMQMAQYTEEAVEYVQPYKDAGQSAPAGHGQRSASPRRSQSDVQAGPSPQRPAWGTEEPPRLQPDYGRELRNDRSDQRSFEKAYEEFRAAPPRGPPAQSRESRWGNARDSRGGHASHPRESRGGHAPNVRESRPQQPREFRGDAGTFPRPRAPEPRGREFRAPEPRGRAPEPRSSELRAGASFGRESRHVSGGGRPFGRELDERESFAQTEREMYSRRSDGEVGSHSRGGFGASPRGSRGAHPRGGLAANARGGRGSYSSARGGSASSSRGGSASSSRGGFAPISRGEVARPRESRDEPRGGPDARDYQSKASNPRKRQWEESERRPAVPQWEAARPKRPFAQPATKKPGPVTEESKQIISFKIQAMLRLAFETAENAGAKACFAGPSRFKKNLRNNVHTRINLIEDEYCTSSAHIVDRYRELYPEADDPSFFNQVKLQTEGLLKELGLEDKKPPLVGKRAKHAAKVAAKRVAKQAAIDAEDKINKIPSFIPPGKIPSYPQGDKKVHNEQKKQGKEEMIKLEQYKVDDDYQKAIDEEVGLIGGLLEKEFKNITNTSVARVYNNVDQEECITKCKKLISMQISKRVTDSGLKLCRIYGSPKPPKRADLEDFLCNYDCLSLKKSVKGPIFTASFASFDTVDKLCAMEPVQMGEMFVTFKPMHIGPPKQKLDHKRAKVIRKDYINALIEKSNVNLLDKNWQAKEAEEKAAAEEMTKPISDVVIVIKDDAQPKDVTGKDKTAREENKTVSDKAELKKENSDFLHADFHVIDEVRESDCDDEAKRNEAEIGDDWIEGEVDWDEENGTTNAEENGAKQNDNNYESIAIEDEEDDDDDDDILEAADIDISNIDLDDLDENDLEDY